MYNATEHPRAPKGTPTGGQFTNKTGVGVDDDLEPVSLYGQYSDNELQTILSDPETDGAKYDNMRTELCQRKIVSSTYRRIDMDTLFRNISVPDGGATYNPYTGKVPTSGFCFSPYPQYSKAFRHLDSPKQLKRALKEFINQTGDLLQQEGHYIGFWNEKETGTIFLDVSVVNYNADDARDACFQYDQISFYDLQVNRSVTVNKNATSGQGVNDD